jgi:hypothetical protein
MKSLVPKSLILENLETNINYPFCNEMSQVFWFGLGYPPNHDTLNITSEIH